MKIVPFVKNIPAGLKALICSLLTIGLLILGFFFQAIAEVVLVTIIILLGLFCTFLFFYWIFE